MMPSYRIGKLITKGRAVPGPLVLGICLQIPITGGLVNLASEPWVCASAISSVIRCYRADLVHPHIQRATPAANTFWPVIRG